MRTLIVEDDPTSQMLLRELLKTYGTTEVACDGDQAIYKVQDALEGKQPFDLICLDIMMPKVTGHEALVTIRKLENQYGVREGHGAKVIMTTALSDKDNIMGAFRKDCDGYIVKPIDASKLFQYLKKLGFQQPPTDAQPAPE